VNAPAETVPPRTSPISKTPSSAFLISSGKYFWISSSEGILFMGGSFVRGAGSQLNWFAMRSAFPATRIADCDGLAITGLLQFGNNPLDA
jgi:hypothetical protein